MFSHTVSIKLIHSCLPMWLVQSYVTRVISSAFTVSMGVQPGGLHFIRTFYGGPLLLELTELLNIIITAVRDVA